MRPVAVLFARADSVYKTLPGCDVWDAERDARRFDLTCPVVAHPPCRAWSRASQFAKPRADEKDLARWAVHVVRHCGGVLEHPEGSSLFREALLPSPGTSEVDPFGGYVLPVWQSWWGHRCEKPTWLYIVGVSRDLLPAVPLVLGQSERVLFNRRGLRSGMHGFRTEVQRAEREHTPPDLARWLVELARRSTRQPQERAA